MTTEFLLELDRLIHLVDDAVIGDELAQNVHKGLIRKCNRLLRVLGVTIPREVEDQQYAYSTPVGEGESESLLERLDTLRTGISVSISSKDCQIDDLRCTVGNLNREVEKAYNKIECLEEEVRDLKENNDVERYKKTIFQYEFRKILNLDPQCDWKVVLQEIEVLLHKYMERDKQVVEMKYTEKALRNDVRQLESENKWAKGAICERLQVSSDTSWRGILKRIELDIPKTIEGSVRMTVLDQDVDINEVERLKGELDLLSKQWHEEVRMLLQEAANKSLQWNRRVELVKLKMEETLSSIDKDGSTEALSSFYQGLNLAYSLLKDNEPLTIPIPFRELIASMIVGIKRALQFVLDNEPNCVNNQTRARIQLKIIDDAAKKVGF